MDPHASGAHFVNCAELLYIPVSFDTAGWGCGKGHFHSKKNLRASCLPWGEIIKVIKNLITLPYPRGIVY